MENIDNLIVVSINCVTYNHEAYVEQALNGMLMQKTDFRYEILIHDDASTDKTQEIIKDYVKRYPDIIKPIFQTENKYSKGVPISFIYNFTRAKGKYIALCEGDDYWTDPFKLQKQVDFLERHHEYIGTAHNVDTVNEHNEPITEKVFFKNMPEHVFSKRDALKFNLIGQTASLVFRNIFADMEPKIQDLFLNVKVNGDQKLSLILPYFGDVYYFKNVMSNYRYVASHGDSWNARTSGVNRSYVYLNQIKDLIYITKELYGISIDIKPYAQHIALSSFIYFLKHPRKENFKVFWKMYNTEPINKVYCLWNIISKLLSIFLNKVLFWKRISN